MSAEKFGYPGDGFGDGENAPANVPSLPGDGDPFFHVPVLPPEESQPSDKPNIDPNATAVSGNCTCLICERELFARLELEFEQELES
ncbi:MAG: hypothetical protein ACXWLH_00780 [Candidatus Saccharimonadales bacterium]